MNFKVSEHHSIFTQLLPLIKEATNPITYWDWDKAINDSYHAIEYASSYLVGCAGGTLANRLYESFSRKSLGEIPNENIPTTAETWYKKIKTLRRTCKSQRTKELCDKALKSLEWCIPQRRGIALLEEYKLEIPEIFFKERCYEVV